MEVGGDPGIDPGGTLAAVDDCAAFVGPRFRDGTNWATEDLEGEGGLVERAEEGAKGELLCDVGVHVLGGQAGRGEVGRGVARRRRGQEGNIPAEGEVVEEGSGIKIGPEDSLPDRYVEGRGG